MSRDVIVPLSAALLWVVAVFAKVAGHDLNLDITPATLVIAGLCFVPVCALVLRILLPNEGEHHPFDRRMRDLFSAAILVAGLASALLYAPVHLFLTGSVIATLAVLVVGIGVAALGVRFAEFLSPF